MVQTTGGLTDFSEETLGKIQASCLEGRVGIARICMLFVRCWLIISIHRISTLSSGLSLQRRCTVARSGAN